MYDVTHTCCLIFNLLQYIFIKPFFHIRNVFYTLLTKCAHFYGSKRRMSLCTMKFCVILCALLLSLLELLLFYLFYRSSIKSLILCEFLDLVLLGKFMNFLLSLCDISITKKYIVIVLFYLENINSSTSIFFLLTSVLLHNVV